MRAPSIGAPLLAPAESWVEAALSFTSAALSAGALSALVLPRLLLTVPGPTGLRLLSIFTI
jgi:hypothetical protein